MLLNQAASAIFRYGRGPVSFILGLAKSPIKKLKKKAGREGQCTTSSLIELAATLIYTDMKKRSKTMRRLKRGLVYAGEK